MPSDNGLAARLGHFVAGTRLTDIPAAVRHEGKRSLLNFVGTALGSARDGAVETAIEVLAPYSGVPQATILGRDERLDAPSAAFVNAIAGNLLDFDDTHPETVIHPTAPVAPVALAMGEELGRSGHTVLEAFVLGAEVECRLGLGVSPGHYARGWHITATAGVFGAAAAAAKLLELNAVQCGHALGIAASQSAGVVENLASSAKNVGVGAAARNGLLAARFAAGGYEAAPAAIEGPLGWAAAAGDEPNQDAIAGALGQRWEFGRNTYKPYPCGIVLHSVIDACLELADRHELDAEHIDSICVHGDALLLARGDRRVENERDARVSIHHAAAVAFLEHRAGVEEFSSAQVADPGTAALRARVRTVLDSGLPQGAAHVVVSTTAGRTYATTVMEARGGSQNPLTDLAIEDKVRRLTRADSGSDSINKVIAAIWEIDTAAPLAELMNCLTAGTH